MNKYRKLVSDTVIFGIGNFTTKLIYFFLMPIYTMALSPKEFGFADLLNNSLQLAIPIFTLCITEGVFRFTLDKESNPTILLSNGLRVVLYGVLSGTIIVGIIYYFSPHSYWLYFLLLYISEALKNLFAQFARGIDKVKVYAANGIIAAVILLTSTYLLLRVFHCGVNGYLLSYILANSVSLIYLLIAGKIYRFVSIRGSFNKIILISLITYSIPLVPNMLSWWITNISSRYIIALYCGLSSSGMFAAASKLPALINIITSVFQLSWQYASVKEYQESEKSTFYSTVFKYYSFIVTILGSLLIALVPLISKFLLKDAFYSAWIYTPLLLFAAMLGCYSTFLGTFYTVVKNSKGIMWTTIIGSVVNLILCFGAIPFLGVIAAVWANVISYMVILIVRINDCRKLLNIRFDWCIPIFALSLTLLQAITMTFGVNPLYTLIIPIGLFTLYGSKGITVWGMIKSFYLSK